MPIKLYDYQRLSVTQLKTGSILCGGVGSGKSMTALAYYHDKECGGNIEGVYKPMKHPKDLYIITTARKRDTLEWEKECAPFLLSTDLKISPVNLVIDSWNNIKKYSSVHGAFFIFDEQRVVGSGTWVKSFINITKKNHWILLSATPGDTWMDYVPVFIANGFYKNRTDFLRKHVVYNRFTKYPKIDHYIECGRLINLRKQILVNMKYTKPTESHHEKIIAKYNEKLYTKISKERWNIFDKKPIRDVSELYYLLRKVTNSDLRRVEEVEKIIRDNPKVIIFYNFDYELELLRKLGKELEITTTEWNGHKHQSIPSEANWIYLVQYTAGAEGWNCIVTNVVIFYSQNYSYKIMKQAAGRIDRLNTPFSDLYYYHIISNSPIDLAIGHSLKKKQNFNENKYSQSIKKEK